MQYLHLMRYEPVAEGRIGEVYGHGDNELEPSQFATMGTTRSSNLAIKRSPLEASVITPLCLFLMCSKSRETWILMKQWRWVIVLMRVV